MSVDLSAVSCVIVDLEIIQLLKKGVIQPCQHEVGEFISPVFTRPKKDGSLRMILTLKSFNVHVTHHHFKMDNIWSAIRLRKPGCYIASIDLKGAYYYVPICKDHQKFLKFEWKRVIPICLFPERISPLSSEVYKAAKASFLKSETTRAHFSCI